MKILVTGSNGLLGQKLVSLLKDDPEVDLLATSKGKNRIPEIENVRYRSLDITVQSEVNDILIEERPDAIIHTAAMTNVDACENDPEGCVLMNVTSVEFLVRAAERINSHFILLSTDFIFDGKNGPYSETDEALPISVYGQSKLDAEKVVVDSDLERWAIVRTIIVYGVAADMSRSNVVLWAKKALEKGDPIRVVNDQWRMPTLAEDLAIGCTLVAKKKATGIFNLSGKDFMSILDLVKRVGEYFQLDTSLITPIASTELGQPAQRPPRTGFVLDKAQTVLGYAPRSFEEGLALLAKQLDR